MKLPLLLLFIFLSFISMAQQIKNEIIHEHIIKTNLVLLGLSDFNLAYTFVNHQNAYELGLGYRIKPSDGEIPYKNAHGIFDATILTTFGGPHITLGYKRYMNNYLERNKNFFNFNMYYSNNDYNKVALYYGSNGTSLILRQLIEEDAQLIGARFLLGKEINLMDHFVFEIFGGVGYVYKYITRNTISEGNSGNYTNIELNEISKREVNNFTLQFGVTLGYIIN